MIKIEITAMNGTELKEHIRALGGQILKDVIVDDTTVEEIVETKEPKVLVENEQTEKVSIVEALPKKVRNKKEKVLVTAEVPPSVVTPVVTERPMEEPKHFYSESEFMVSMPKILNSLTVDKIIDTEWIKNQCSKLGVTIIFSAAQDKSKLSSMYEDLVSEGKIIKKGDY